MKTVLDDLVDAAEELAADLAAGRRVVARTVEVRPPPVYRGKKIARIRKKLGTSQTVFARLIGASPAAVRAWERGAKRPSGLARRMLQLVNQQPEWFTNLVTERKSRTSARRG